MGSALVESSVSGSAGAPRVAFFDTGAYLAVIRVARDTPWLHAAAAVYTVAGFVVLALLLVAAGLRARHGSNATVAVALACPVGVGLAFGLDELIRTAVREVRPCDTLHVTDTVLACDPPTDLAFPSNHSAVAGALAVAVLLPHRRPGAMATLFALVMGGSRTYVGAHYPHDVIAGLLLGAVCSLAVGLLVRATGAGAVRLLRAGRLRPLLGSGIEQVDSAPRPATRPAGIGHA